MPYGEWYPQTRQEMLRAGYKFLGEATCRRCNAAAEWWQSTRGVKLLFDPSATPTVPPADDTSPAVLHYKGCKGDVKQQPQQQSLFQGTIAQRQQALGQLAAACRARCVVLLQDDDFVYSFRPGIPGEDLAHELITVANKIRRDLGGNTQ